VDIETIAFGNYLEAHACSEIAPADQQPACMGRRHNYRGPHPLYIRYGATIALF
jgi:hypothetical protein